MVLLPPLNNPIQIFYPSCDLMMGDVDCAHMTFFFFVGPVT